MNDANKQIELLEDDDDHDDHRPMALNKTRESNVYANLARLIALKSDRST